MSFFIFLREFFIPSTKFLFFFCRQSNVKPVRPFAVDETVSTKDDEVFPLGNETETDVEGAYIERRNGISLKNKDIAPQDVQANLLNAEDVDRRRENEENG